MSLPDITPHLKSVLPDLRGGLEAHVPMAPFSWFRAGGRAQALLTAADEADLAYALARIAPDIPVLVIGLGSNLLVRDGGLEGLVIRLGKGFQDIQINGNLIRAGAGAADVKVAAAAAEAGLAGLSFLRGIPGTIGGALRMNGGAYGRETADALVECRALDRPGKAHTFSKADMGFTYRHCGIAEDMIFTSALFEGSPADADTIRADMLAITKARAATQPVNTRTGGSTFKNPPGHKAWELIDAAGCRGLVRGDAQVSELHCNFLINRGKASAADIEALGEQVRETVLARTGIMLEWEIRRVGRG